LAVRFAIRAATVDDAATLAHHRAAMFRDMGSIRPEMYDAMAAASRAYFASAMPRGEYVAWVVTPDDQTTRIVAGAGVQIRRILPRPDGSGLMTGPEAIVLNVYTEPDWRRLGIAGRLMRHIIAWSRAQHIRRLVLHASDNGRRLYEKLGFTPTNEMILSGNHGDEVTSLEDEGAR
jgi:GNAT superfamily N-acetyltransferase